MKEHLLPARRGPFVTGCRSGSVDGATAKEQGFFLLTLHFSFHNLAPLMSYNIMLCANPTVRLGNRWFKM